jgi:tight adherence protein B
LGAGLLTSILISVVSTPVGTKLFLNSRKHIYAYRIDSQLSEACRLLSSAARAGLSVTQGLELVVKEMPPPISHELGIVYREVKLGKNLDLSLRDMLERVSSKNLQVFVNALIIQRKAGGDLARLLSEMARTMEERKIITQTIQASVSQAKYSAYALPLVSIFIVIILSKMIDGFFDLITSFTGLIIFAIFLFLQILGVYLVRKISDIKV